MALGFGKKRQVRSDPVKSEFVFVGSNEYNEMITDNYMRLSDSPEIRMGVERIVDMVP